MMTRRRLLGLLLASYPSWWRRRYGAEAAAILEHSPPTLRTALDLLRGAVDAWTRQRPPQQRFFARFGDDARAVLVRAQKEARALHHDYLGTEHILLGLLAAPDNAAGRVLTTLGVSPARVRARLIEIIGQGCPTAPSAGAGAAPSAELPKWSMRLTPRTKQGFAHACRAADQLGDQDVGADHLLLGLLDAEGGIGVQLVAEVVALEAVRQALARERQP
jgi:ATP-dependent Clp protease ATP-binding subunit ClpA